MDEMGVLGHALEQQSSEEGNVSVKITEIKQTRCGEYLEMRRE
jgi:hypothetical protein